jgi:ceramide synthetase
MFLHHVATVTLIIVSYNVNFLLPGSVIMLLHDVSDFFLSLSIISYFCGSDKLLISSMVAMFASWIYLRLYYFPDRIIKPYYDYYMSTEDPTIIGTFNFLFPFLLILYILHWFWFFLFCRIVVNRYGSFITSKICRRSKK